jgi:hypothetical protein
LASIGGDPNFDVAFVFNLASEYKHIGGDEQIKGASGI